MAKRASLRASDADRDRVAERLHLAATEGRLMAHELEDRLARALRASTYGELDPLVDDLPGAPVAMVTSRPRGLAVLRRHPLAVVVFGCAVGLTLATVLAAMMAMAVSGVWVLPLVAILVLRGRSSRMRQYRRERGLGHMHAQARRYGRF